MKLETVDPKTVAFAQALLGALTRFPDPTFFLYTFVDHLHIAFGPHLGLHLADRTLSDLARLTTVTVDPVARQAPAAIDEGGLQLGVVSAASAREQLGKEELKRRVAEASSLVIGLREAARAMDAGGWEEIVSRLREALAQISRRGERSAEQSGLMLIRVPGQGLAGLSEGEHARLVESFFLGLAPLLEEQSADRFLSVEGFVHLVPTVRYHRSSGESRLRRVLTPGQAGALGRLLGSEIPGLGLDREEALPATVAQAAARGFVSVGEADPGDPGLRFDLAVAARRRGAARPTQVLAMPCTVGRVPWLVLHTLCTSDQTPDWWKALILYRDLVPRIFQHVRVLAQASFCQALQREFSRALNADLAPEPWLAALRDAWLKVGAAFPFPLPDIQLSGALEVPPAERPPVRLTWKGQRYVIHRQQQRENPFFAEGFYARRDASWGPIDASSMERLFFEPIEALLREHELTSSRNQIEIARLVYQVGHPFKHRSQDTLAAAGQASLELRTLQEELAASEATRAVAARLDALAEVLEVTRQYAQASNAYGDLVNLLARCLEQRGPTGLLTKDEWHGHEPVSLAAVVHDTVTVARNKGTGRIAVRLVPGEGTDALANWEIQPWIASPRGPAAPSQKLYEEIFLELVGNAANHGVPSNRRVPLVARVEVPHRGPPAVLLENPFHLPEGRAWQPRFQPVPREGASGAALVAGLLDRLELGTLEARSTPGAAGAGPGTLGTFTYRLVLTGLTRAG